MWTKGDFFFLLGETLTKKTKQNKKTSVYLDILVEILRAEEKDKL